MSGSGNSFLLEIKSNAEKNIKPDELYSQQEVIEKLAIARNSFKKYFSSDKEWLSQACLRKGRAQYYKGEFIIYKAISISDSELISSNYETIEEAINEVNVFLDSIGGYLDTSNEFSGVMKPVKDGLISKKKLIDSFVSMRKNDLNKNFLYKDASYWQDKLAEKPG